MSTATGSPRFDVDSSVRVQTVDVGPYKRPPEYTVGAVGTVQQIHGTYATSTRGNSSYLYSVRFASDVLWEDGDPNGSVHVDLWEECIVEADG